MRKCSPIILSRVLLLLAGPFFISCSKEICNAYPDPAVKISLLSVNEAGLPVNAGLDSTTVFGWGTDSLLYDDVDNLSKIKLPLSPVSDTSVFVFQIGSVSDTMRYIYNRNLIFVSQECGYAMTFDITEIASTDNLIDSIVITNPRIRTIDSTNVWIFF